MRVISFRGAKTLLVTAILGVAAGWFSWMILPSSPRNRIPIDHWYGRMALSSDGRLVVRAYGDTDGMRHWKGDLRIWDTREQRLLCTIPYSEVWPPATDGGHSIAFTPEGDKLVAFAFGQATFYDVSSGEQWEPAVKHKFPSDGARETPSWLVSDAEGNLFVMVHDRQAMSVSVRDLWTAREVATWQCNAILERVPGGVIEQSLDGISLRELPGGKSRQHLAARPPSGKQRTSSLTATPDCRTLVHIDGQIRVFTDETAKEYDLPADQFPAVSPNGRLLATGRRRERSSPTWLADLLGRIGIRPSDRELVIYDLTTGQRIAQLPDGRYAQFSNDGNTLAVATDEWLEIYDVPLAKPWGQIIGMALACASLVFGLGQWLRWRRRTRIQPTETLVFMQKR